MTNKEILNKFVHNKENILALEIFIDWKVEKLKEELVYLPLDRVHGQQQLINELRKMKKIREIVEGMDG